VQKGRASFLRKTGISLNLKFPNKRANIILLASKEDLTKHAAWGIIKYISICL